MFNLPISDYVFHKAGKVYRINRESNGDYVVNDIMVYNKIDVNDDILVLSNSVTNFPYPLRLNLTPKDKFKSKLKGGLESVLDPNPIELLNYDKLYTLIDGCNQEVIVTPAIDGCECEGEVYPNIEMFGDTIRLSGNRSASNRSLRVVKRTEVEGFEHTPMTSLKRVVDLINKGHKFFDTSLNEVKVSIKDNKVLCKGGLFESISFLGNTISLKRKSNSLLSEILSFVKDAPSEITLNETNLNTHKEINFSKAKFFKDGEEYDVRKMSDGSFLIDENNAFKEYETINDFFVTFKNPIMGKKDTFSLYYAYADKLDVYDMLMLEGKSRYFFDDRTNEYVNLVKHKNGTFTIGDKTYNKCSMYYEGSIKLENTDEYRVLNVFTRTHRARDIVIDTISKVKYCDNAYVKVAGGYLFVTDDTKLVFCNEEFDDFYYVNPIGVKNDMFVCEVSGHLKLFQCKHQYVNKPIKFETYNFAEELSELYVKFTKHLNDNGLICSNGAEIKSTLFDGLIIKAGDKEYSFADISKLEINDDSYVITLDDTEYNFYLYNRVS